MFGVTDSAASAFPLNRVVVLATPLLASAAAVLGGWLVNRFPLGQDRVDEGTRRSVMLAASASATAMAYKWLDGWQQHAEQEFTIENGMVATESLAVRDTSVDELALDGDVELGVTEADPES